MRSLLAAIAFLTRLPIGRFIVFDFKDVARSALWFPLIGALLGLIYAFTAMLLREHLPLPVVAILLVGLDALLTGALHFDGLADTADGFGGGKDRDDILRIMRDHKIGSYGATALILLIALKVAAYSAVLASRNYFNVVVLTAALGRWSLVLLSASLPYARSSPSVVNDITPSALVLGTAMLFALLAAVGYPRAWVAAWVATTAVLVVTACFGAYSRRRIGGITGDVLGANLELSEGAALIAFLWSSQA